MNYLELKDNQNNVIDKWPYEQYELNEHQQFVCIGGDFSKYGGVEKILDSHLEVHAQPIGKVSEQNFIFASQIRNSLVLNGWDFKIYPDPEVILLTRKVKT